VKDDAPWEVNARIAERPRQPDQKRAKLHIQLNAKEVIALQRLAQPDILDNDVELHTWLSIERVLRHYAQYHFEQPIRSASLIETCFLPPVSPAKERE
jgi:DNA repair protein RecO (recombination protein O)